MRIGKIASGAEYEMVEQFQNSTIFGISIVFQIEKVLKIHLFSNLGNSNLEYFKNFYNWLIWEMIRFSKLFNLRIYEFSKFYNLENPYFTFLKIIKYFGCPNNFKKMKK